MNNKDYGHITPELLDQVKAVLEDAANHKYSVSRIYGAHNQVFKLSETPESCASCLRKRASALKKWYGEYVVLAEDAKLDTADALLSEGDALIDEVAKPFTVSDKDGKATEVKFNGESLIKQDGKTLKPGTYITAEGATYTVQPGGKATLKDDLL